MTDHQTFTQALEKIGCSFVHRDVESTGNIQVRIDVGHNDVQDVIFVFDKDGKFIKVFK